MRTLVFFVLTAYLLPAQDLAERAHAVLAQNCLGCHSSAAKLSGLDLSTREAALKGGHAGPALVPGDAAASRLYKAVARMAGVPAMPAAKPLPAAAVATLKEWIDAGAPWLNAPSTPIPNWWSFQPVRRPAVPAASPWAKNPIDHFIAAKHAEKGFRPAPEADRATLVRRVYLDLTGLPPTAAQLAAAPPYEQLVDHLLASPRYGEKWGRYWLDLVRYSDTAGFELDTHIPDAWRYRDYVIDSFNNDKPYPLFLREQIAGDELFRDDPVAITGTGYYCVGPNRDYFPDQADINRVETLTDFVDTTSSVILGLSAGCARCHDHKFDPIPQRDYFRLQAIFAPFVKTRIPLSRLESLGFDTAENKREIQLREIGEQIRSIQKDCKDLANCSDPRLLPIQQRLVKMFAGYKSKPFACGITDISDVSPKTFIPGKGKQEILPGFFTALGGGDVSLEPPELPVATGPIPYQPTTGRRAALAAWLTKEDHPLTNRVIVNRIWQQHFGRGVVATPNDFGTRGAPPSHPELLDWLASEFAAQGGSFKRLHRLILTSATYRQAVAPNPADPENVYLAGFKRRRLAAEEIHDAVLQSAGSLNLKMYGKPVVPPLSKEELFNLIGRPEDTWVLSSDPTEYTRRAVYMFNKRTFRLPMMEVFDAPESMMTCARRESSTSAPQSLSLFNGDFLLRQARAMAAELATAPDPIQTVWQRILVRPPTAAESQSATAFLATQQQNAGTREAALTELVRGLFNLNEFLYVD
jgi:mono/diheme cytochrome c family protein